MNDVQSLSIEGTEETPEVIPGDGTGVEEEDTSREERIVQPFDPTLIRVEPKLLTVDLLISRLKHGELNLTPGFQRKPGIWNDAAQSRLIESMLIRIPLPSFYLDATNDDDWLVVDGLQRLTALRRFVIDQKLRLSGLEFLTNLDGTTFDDLPRHFQRRINETQVTIYLIEKGTPPEVKFNIFKRINTGGLPLSAQEIRHALNQGKVTKLLELLAGSHEFRRATDNGIRDDRMADRESVLRFLAFTITPYEEYRVQDFDGFLNKTMAEINTMSDLETDKLKAQFLRAMSAASAVFGNDAFRKRYDEASYRYPINKALFEAWSVSLNRLSDAQLELLKSRRGNLRKRFIKLMNLRDFDSAISQGTGDIRKIRLRFNRIEQIIQEIIK